MDACSRLAIFQCSDRQGIIDDYIPYLLNDLKENLTRLVIVVNGKLTAEGRKKLTALTDEVFVRENKGFDAAAWKCAMTEYLGWDEVDKYDELVLLNDTFFGPFYPFKEVFQKMEKRDVDFWGLTAHGAIKNDPFANNPYHHWPAHLQSYFLVIRKTMHTSFNFKQYWEKQPIFKSFEELVGKNETVFTKWFSDKGFTWDSYINMKDMDVNGSINHYAFNPLELIKRGCPIFKRKPLSESLRLKLEYDNGEGVPAALNYIQTHYDYDIKIIWENILRVYNITDIYHSLRLNYIIDNEYAACQTKVDAIIVLHITYTDKLDRYIPYIKNIPQNYPVIITTISEEKKAIIHENLDTFLGNRLTVIVMPNRGRDLAALLIAAAPLIREHKYFCFCHDKMSKQLNYVSANAFEKIIWENLLSSKQYINNILMRFEADANLGLLCVPSTIGGMIGNFNSKWWTCNYENTVAVLERLNIDVPISTKKEVLSVGTAFWARTKALENVLSFAWKYTDFPKEPLGIDGTLNHALERCFPFVAQHSGYYTAVAMTAEYAEILLSDYKYLTFKTISNNDFNYMTINDENCPQTGVHGALRLLKYTLKKWFKRKINNSRYKDD